MQRTDFPEFARRNNRIPEWMITVALARHDVSQPHYIYILATDRTENAFQL